MALKETHWELLDFSASYTLPYCEQCEEGSDSHVNKVLETIGIEYTKIITILYYTGISTSTAGITTIRFIWFAWYVC